MSTPTETLWELEPHTGAKHSILRSYLGAWFGIMGRTFPRIIYIDGFCGPGRYKKGEEGSPILALKLALEHYAKNNLHEVSFVFVEENKERAAHLLSEIASLTLPSTFNVYVKHNQFENTLCDILDSLDQKGAKLAPTFAFIDPFGFKGAPYKLVERLLKNPKTEIFINIMADSVNRFIDHPDAMVTNHIVDLFGTDKVLKVLDIGGNRLQRLKELYQVQLEKCAKYVRYFEMRDENDRVIYYLYFATNNALGHIKMKEAFWKVDSSAGYHFSDATNPDQLVLFKDDTSIKLADIYISKYKGKRISVSSIRQFTEDMTSYTKSHMIKALLRLEEDDKLCVEPCKEGGEKRRKRTFPDDVIVTFPRSLQL